MVRVETRSSHCILRKHTELNVIEQHGRKIMFERGSEVEGILVVEEESILLMEKIRILSSVYYT